MDSSTPFTELQSTISSALVSTTRASNRLAAEDIAFHRSLDRNIAKELDVQNARLLGLAERLLGNAASGAEVVGPTFPDGREDLEHKWRNVVDVVDSLLERADISLDEFTGAIKKVDNAIPQAQPARSSRKSAKNFQPANLDKPQLLFQHPPQNYQTGPWKPLLTKKYHGSVPLQQSVSTFETEKGQLQYQHPYQNEIEASKFPDFVYTKAEPIPSQPYESSTATFVDTPEALAEMLAELKNAKEIAIDLEHHEHRTFSGLLSLMQISTRDKDWVVDTLKPWRRKLECLNEVFTDPNILKVLHGAYMDIVWLQRDLGLYIVGLFDTHWASRALGYAGGSLAFLLQKFVNFEAQKQYQTADWRIRPLPTELFDYARSDTHFLLYIYDNMRNELIDRSNFDDPEQDKVQYVLEKSRDVALQRYETSSYDPEGLNNGGWLRLLYKTPANFSKEQFSVFRAVHRWRDTVAREEDEGTYFLLANHALFNIAREMPQEPPKLLSLAAPVSPVVRQRADELLSVISKAKQDGPNGPDLVTVLENYKRERMEVYLAKQPTVETPPPTATLETAPPIVANGDSARSTFSSFWGSSIFRSFWPQRRFHSTLASASDISLAVPLPPLTAEVFADPAHAPQTPVAKPEHQFVRKEDRPVEKDEDEVFVIKQLGGLRKRKQPVQDDEEPSSDVQALDPAAEQKAKEKAARKAEKKAAKRLKKEQEAAQVSGNGMTSDAPETVPFDYENAPSVLHAQRDAEATQTKQERREKKKQSTAFDPFKRAADAPKGLRRKQKPEEGRSKTFR